ncbi:MAG: mechanosensitive ion channel domain-containing protein [Pirellula sp.]
MNSSSSALLGTKHPASWLARLMVVSCVALIQFAPSIAQESSPPPSEKSTPSQPDDDSSETSEAERVASLQEAVENDRKQLQALETELDNPNSEYELAEKAFRKINSEIDETQQQLDIARKSNDDRLTLRLEQEIASLERQRKLAEDRFDLAIEDRKTLRDQRATLRLKIEHDQAALDELVGEDDAQTKAELRASKDDFHEDRKQRPDKDHDRSESSESETTRESMESEDSRAAVDEQDEEIVQAAAEATKKEQEADAAQEETRSIASRLSDIQKLVAQEQKELDLARKKVELANAAQQALTQELERRQAEQADATELNELRASIGQTNQRLIQARLEVSEISERLNDHRAEQSSLQSEHIVALHELQQKRREADTAEDLVASLRNPFTLRNILQWLIEHGPRLLAIIIGMFLLNRLASFFANRSVRLVSSGTGRGSTIERENRAKTLVGVFQNAATVAIFIGGSLTILEEVGANITVLMGGVAVIGLAVAFGAQNLIKDYFYGFVMLLENQYMLNDSVRIGGVSGQVERITLRMTVLRDSNGVVHFIPNGTINSVSNETHGWSRAVCEISISHREELDRVVGVLREISRELKSDPHFGPLMLEAPTEPAIESLGDSAVHLKVAAKTLPSKQGAVKQEWLKRIKNRFTELGIDPPVQQRIVHLTSNTAPAGTEFDERFGPKRMAG